jgi:hypothetical protein
MQPRTTRHCDRASCIGALSAVPPEESDDVAGQGALARARWQIRIRQSLDKNQPHIVFIVPCDAVAKLDSFCLASTARIALQSY